MSHSIMKAREIQDPAGGRNVIRAGDGVKVTRGGHDPQSFRAVFVDADLGPGGEVQAVTVFGGRGYDPAREPMENGAAIAQFRTVLPARIQRLSQAHIERRRA